MTTWISYLDQAVGASGRRTHMDNKLKHMLRRARHKAINIRASAVSCERYPTLDSHNSNSRPVGCVGVGSVKDHYQQQMILLNVIEHEFQALSLTDFTKRRRRTDYLLNYCLITTCTYIYLVLPACICASLFNSF